MLFVAVDTTEAGMGDIDVEVMQGTVSVPVRRQNLCPEQARFCFIATSPKDHLINVTFNSELIPRTRRFFFELSIKFYTPSVWKFNQ